MVSENICEQINNAMRDQNTEDKENSEVSSHNDQISELSQVVQNMGKFLAVITEKNRNNQHYQPQYLHPQTNQNLGEFPQMDSQIPQ